MKSKLTEATWTITLLAVMATFLIGISVFICGVLFTNEPQGVDQVGFGDGSGQGEIPCRYINQINCR